MKITIQIDSDALIVVSNTDKIYPASMMTNIDRLSDSLALYSNALRSRTHLKSCSIKEISNYAQDAKAALSFAAILMVELHDLYKRKAKKARKAEK